MRWPVPNRAEYDPRRTLFAFLGLVLVFVVFWRMSGARFGTGDSTDTLAVVGPQTLTQLTAMGKPGVVEFYTPSSADAGRVAGNLSNIERRYGDAVFVVKVDSGRYPAEAERYGVQEFPTLVYFDSSGAVKATVSGYETEAKILARMKDLGFID